MVRVGGTIGSVNYASSLTYAPIVPVLTILSLQGSTVSGQSLSMGVANEGAVPGIVNFDDGVNNANGTVTLWDGNGTITVTVPDIITNNLKPGTVTVTVTNTGATENDTASITITVQSDWSSLVVVSQDTSADAHLDATPTPVATDVVRWENYLRLVSDNSLTAYAVTVNNDLTYTIAGNPTADNYYFTFNFYDNSDNTWGVSAQELVDIVVLIAPTMPADTSVNVVEGNTAAGTHTATTGTLPITYSISGIDASDFTINASTGVLVLNSASDYEAKVSYTIIVTATNSEGSDAQNLIVNITNVNEIIITPPVDISIEFSYGGNGLTHSDATLNAWLSTAINATSNDFSSLVDPVPAGMHVITFSANDAADQTAILTLAEAVPAEDDAVIASFRVYPGVSINTRRTLFPENTHVVELYDTQFAVAGSLIDDANVSLTLRSGGIEITGQAWPTVLLPVIGESGLYRAVLSHQMDLSNPVSGRVEADIKIVKEASQAKYHYVLSVQSRGS